MFLIASFLSLCFPYFSFFSFLLTSLHPPLTCYLPKNCLLYIQFLGNSHWCLFFPLMSVSFFPNHHSLFGFVHFSQESLNTHAKQMAGTVFTPVSWLKCYLLFSRSIISVHQSVLDSGRLRSNPLPGGMVEVCGLNKQFQVSPPSRQWPR